MKVWAMGDFHLSLGVVNKSMEVFGPRWLGYVDKMAYACHQYIVNDDLLLIPGDISWASSLKDAKKDLEWIDALPGIKILLKGNHDHWWPSNRQLSAILPPSIKFIYNNSITVGPVSIGGTRFWDVKNQVIDSTLFLDEKTGSGRSFSETDERIYQRELCRLERSLSQIDPQAKIKIAMTHYPPIGTDLVGPDTLPIFKEYGIHHVVFGHLHGIRETAQPFGTVEGIVFTLTSSDFLQFQPKLIAEV